MATLTCHRWISSVLIIIGLACVASETRVQRGARDWDAERRRMVDEQLRARDIRSAPVLDTMLRYRVICSFLSRSGPRPTAIRRCQSDTIRPSPNRISSRS